MASTFLASAAVEPPSLDRRLKSTTGRCLVCHRPSPVEVWTTEESPARVFLRRTCPEHGEQ